MALRHVVFFDGDDTLWKTQELYDEAKQKFASLLESVGIQEKGIIPQLDELDARRVSVRGFTIERFAESMLILYRQLAFKHNLKHDLQLYKKIHRITALVKRPPQLYEDALPALEELKGRARLVLVSAGDLTVQKRKLHSLQISHRFEQVCIVPFKSEERLQQILQEVGLSPNNAWLVGNSPRSDILPALTVGMNAVLVARGTWRYDELSCVAGPRAINKHPYAVSSLSEATGIILNELERDE